MKIFLKILTILSLFLFVFAMPAFAQSATKWYWAYIEKQQQVISYDVSGNTHILLENVRPSNLYRIDDLTAVVMIEQQNDYSAYILTSDNAYPVAKIYTADLPDDYYVQRPDGVEALALMPPYILIWNHKYTQPLLFNRETQAVQTLNLESWETLRLSKDGRHLRYFVSDNVDKNNDLIVRWHIAEYDVQKAITRIIFKRDEKAPAAAEFINEFCKPDTYGEKWFCNQGIGIYPENGGMPQSKSEIIHLDGQTEAVADNQYLKVGLNGDWFLLTSDSYNQYCDESCVFQITNYSTGEKQSFSGSQMNLPQGVKFTIPYTEVLDSNHLLFYDVQGQRTVYLLQDKTRLSYLGVVPCCHIAIISEDYRWRVFDDLRDKDHPYVILMDMQSGRIILREAGIADLVGFTDNGAYLDGQTFYSYRDC